MKQHGSEQKKKSTPELKCLPASELQAFHREQFKLHLPNWRGQADGLQLYDDIGSLLDKLMIAAHGGDRFAQQLIWQVAVLCINTLDVITYCDRKSILELAKNVPVWPTLIHYHPEYVRQKMRAVKSLPLAENLCVAIPKRKPYSLLKAGTLNNEVHLQFNRLGCFRSKDFPALDGSPKVLDLYFDAIWELICEKGPPEKGCYRKYGVSAAEEKRDSYPEGTAAYESNVRNGIRQRCRKAFQAMIKCKK